RPASGSPRGGGAARTSGGRGSVPDVPPGDTPKPARDAVSADAASPSADAPSADPPSADAPSTDPPSADAPSADAASPDDGAPPSVTGLLAAAVDGIGGTARPGQDAMAGAGWRAIGTGEHLAVQAGTGTGKSLAYLVPAAAHAIGRGSSVVVATATIALHRQLIDRDLPPLTPARAPRLERAAPPPGAGGGPPGRARGPPSPLLKGPRNYLCPPRRRAGPPDEPGETLF